MIVVLTMTSGDSWEQEFPDDTRTADAVRKAFDGLSPGDREEVIEVEIDR